jgi:hypothetical protein
LRAELLLRRAGLLLRAELWLRIELLQPPPLLLARRPAWLVPPQSLRLLRTQLLL